MQIEHSFLFQCSYCWLGNIGYKDAVLLQERLASQIANQVNPQTFLLLEHPHTFTLGRSGKNENILWDEIQQKAEGVETLWIDRGGGVTYHGPGQLVGYPLLSLAEEGWQGERLPQADFVGYLRKLEKVLIAALDGFGVEAYPRPGFTGVWTGQQPAKIGSIGVKVDVHGVSKHGFALNISPDMHYWEGIVACGIEGVEMTSLAQLMTSPPTTSKAAQMVASKFGEIFECEMVEVNPAELGIEYSE